MADQLTEFPEIFKFLAGVKACLKGLFCRSPKDILGKGKGIHW